MRSAGWFFLLCCFLAPATAQKDDAKRILEAFAKRYDQARSFAMEGTITILAKLLSIEKKTVTTFDLAFQKPNKVRFVIKDAQGKVRQMLVSDGSELFNEIPALRQVMKRPVPKSGVPLLGGDIMSGLLKGLLAKVKEAKVIGKEKLRQQKAKVIKAVTEGNITVLLWVANDILWQVKTTIKGDRFTKIIAFNKVTFNPQFSPATFSYKPPADFKVVEEFKLPMQPGPIAKPAP